VLIQTSPIERRKNIARSIVALTAKNGALTADEKRRMSDYTAEMNEIERQLGSGLESRHAEAFRDWLRVGGDAVSLETQKTMREVRSTLGVESTPTGGAYPGSGAGFFAPESFVAEVSSAMKWASPFFEPGFCDLRDTPDGRGLPFPTDSDTSISGEQISESSVMSSQDVSLSQVVLGSYRFSSKLVFASNEVLQDSGIDFPSYLAEKFSIRLARALASPLTSGSGGGAGPTGALYGLSPALTATGSSDTDGASGADSIGLGDLVALEQSLDPSYRANAKFMMHPSAIAHLKTRKDANKRPIFESLINNGTLLGYPVFANTAMDQLQTSTSNPVVNRTPIALGDFHYFKVRRARPLIFRISQRYAEQSITAFLTVWRVDSALIGDSAAVKTLQTTY
jgi:HK97 family phage major capsid protein